MTAASDQPTILQVLPSMHSGGVERGTVEIADAIQAEGWTALVASAGGPMVEMLRAKKVEHIEIPLASKNPFTMWRNIRRLRKLIRERNISLIHARSRAPAWSAYMAAKKEGIPFITTYHGTYGSNCALKRFYNSVMAKGDRVIAISNFIREHIHKHHTVDESRIRIIHRGADIRYFAPDNADTDTMMSLAQSWALPENCPPIILLPGRITRWKGQHTFIEALAQIQDLEWLAVIMGDVKNRESYMAELDDLVDKYDLRDRIRFAPNSPHMREAYALSNVIVSPSTLPEAFGRIPVEAQAMAKPIIATKHGGAMETVLEGETGQLPLPNDANALANAIKIELARDPEERVNTGLKAVQHVTENFSIEKMQRSTLDVYKELLNG